ncbi:hypothetical protein QMZ30_11930 [Pantoea sp. EA-12]|uniref:hypothetical protein n=1 Tax=Pantoea sp. EA-12 TaxID=3043303 RepID=UPI0024B5D0EB|nr:hypothetical protein [Pantoea sp. EA-12]MDI9221608.1 hypothetical protein [Pantoea sp. EA-12]
MDINTSQVTDEINMAIGRAVSHLIAAGKRVEKNSILEQLIQFEKEAVDGNRQVYATAIHLVLASSTEGIN